MNKVIFIISIVISTLPFAVQASPVSTNSAGITMVRPYLGGSVYVQLDSKVLCDTNIFLIDAEEPGKAVMYSAALAALMSNKKVKVEALTATGCTGWGTMLQSLYLFSN